MDAPLHFERGTPAEHRRIRRITLNRRIVGKSASGEELRKE